MKRLAEVLDLDRLALPAEPRVVGLRYQPILDWLDNEAINIVVVVEETTTEEPILAKAGPIKDAIRAAHRDARGDPGPVQVAHASSPKPLTTSASRASMAWCSSSPSAVTSIAVPWDAASRRIPRIDLPSISLSLKTTFTWASKREASATNLAAARAWNCILYTSDAADERSSGDLCGRRIIKKKKNRRAL